MVELHSTLPPLGPAEDGDCKSPIPGWSSCTRPRRPSGRRKTATASRRSRDGRVARDPAAPRPVGRRRLQVADPGMVELHATPPPLGPAEDGDCKSPIPGWSSCTRPCRPSGRRKTTTASRRSRDGRVALDPAAPRADGRRDCKSPIPGWSSCTRPCRPSGRRKTATASRRSRDGRVARDPAAPRAGGRRRLQVADPGMVELHATLPPLGPAEDGDCKSPIPGWSSCTRPCRPSGRRKTTTASRRSRDGRVARDPADPGMVGPTLPPLGPEDGDCKSPIPGWSSCTRPCRPSGRSTTPPASRRSRDGRVALDPAAPRAVGRRRLQVADPGMVELHSTPPPLGPAEDGDCKSPIPGWSSCTRPCRPSGRRKTTTASRRSRDGRVARDPAAPRADGRRRLQVADPGMVELHSTLPPLGPTEDDDCKSPIPGWSSCTRPCRPSGRRKTATASRRSRDGRVALDPAAPRADGRRRLQVADPGDVGVPRRAAGSLAPGRMNKTGGGSG
jgi:hypothetical protein